MEIEVITEAANEQDAAIAAAPAPAAETAAEAGTADAEEAEARWPDVAAFLPGVNLWLYAVPVILLLFLWLFYPVILVLICIILALWWLG